MTFPEKLVALRKQKGITQEALAFELGVSRQSVSKWESGESEPSASALRGLSEVFQVRIDYLLNEHEEQTEISFSQKVSLNDANNFLAITRKNAFWTAFATLLCILSPICLFILGAMSEKNRFSISENVAVGIGMIVLLIFISASVCIFLLCDHKISAYAYLEKEAFEAERSVLNKVTTEKNNYKSAYVRNNVLGSCLCILSVIPLFIGLIYNEENDLLMAILFSCMIGGIGIGVFFFVLGGTIWGGFDKLLQQGDYSPIKKAKAPARSALSVVYWLLVTASFFLCSFPKQNWKYSGMVWVIGGILYPAVIAIFNVISKKK